MGMIEHLPHPKDNDPSTLVSTVEKLDTFSETAPCQDASHLLQALDERTGRRGTTRRKDVSINCRPPKLQLAYPS